VFEHHLRDAANRCKSAKSPARIHKSEHFPSAAQNRSRACGRQDIVASRHDGIGEALPSARTTAFAAMPAFARGRMLLIRARPLQRINPRRMIDPPSVKAIHNIIE
jgi:hypothetical protein